MRLAGAFGTTCHGASGAVSPVVARPPASVAHGASARPGAPSHPPSPAPQVLHDMHDFAADAAHLDSMDFQKELGSDYVLSARVQLSK